VVSIVNQVETRGLKFIDSREGTKLTLMELSTIFRDGLLHYFLLCLVSVATGIGLLRLFRVDLPLRMALAFAPLLTAGCWVVVLGIGVTLRIPVRSLAGPLWVLTLGIALFGLYCLLARVWIARYSLGFGGIGIVRRVVVRPDNIRNFAGQSWMFIVCLVLPLAIMLPYFVQGLINHPRSTHPDGWVYIAFGQYLWSYPRGVEGGLAALYQYGSRLSNTRFISSSLLGFLSPLLSAGDTQMSSGLFLAWGLFTFASSCAFFSTAQGLSASRRLIYLLLTVFSGWICNIIWVNNYDNMLALAYFPVLVGSINWLSPRSWSWRFVLGFLGTGLLYCYPEFALLTLGGVLLVVLDQYWSNPQDRRSWLLMVGWAIGLAVVLAAPYIPGMYSFIYNQATVGLQPRPRPGEGLFVGLLQLRYLPAAFWGLGGEYKLDTWLFVRNALGCLFSLLAALGFVRLIRCRRIGFATMILLLLIACGSFILIQQYSYGTYKFILLVWWAMCYLLVLGLDGLLLRLRAVVPRYLASGLCALMVLLTLLFNHYGIGAPNRFMSPYDRLAISEFRQLEQIKQITNGAGMLVMVDDWLANYWAVYFLRDTPIDLGAYRLHMAQPVIIPLMQRAWSIRPEEVRYVLTEGSFDSAFGSFPGAKLIWSGGPYHLWEMDIHRDATIAAITNENGVQQVNGETFFWMGQGDTTLEVFIRKSGVLHLEGIFQPGPSVPDRRERTILVSTNTGYHNQFTLIDGDRSISFPVVAGRVTVTLRPLDQPTLTTLANGDRRPLILGVRGLTAVLDDRVAVLEQLHNAYGVGQLNGQPFFWMGTTPTELRVYTIRAGTLVLRARFMPGPSLPKATVHRLQVESDAGHYAQVSIEGGNQQITVPVQPGITTIRLTALDTPTVLKLANGDTRVLLLGVKGLTIRLDP
jgi:hypothetical protein